MLGGVGDCLVPASVIIQHCQSIVYVVLCHGLLLLDLEIGKPGAGSCHHCWPSVVGKLSRWKGGMCEEVSGRYLVKMEVLPDNVCP